MSCLVKFKNWIGCAATGITLSAITVGGALIVDKLQNEGSKYSILEHFEEAYGYRPVQPYTKDEFIKLEALRISAEQQAGKRSQSKGASDE